MMDVTWTMPSQFVTRWQWWQRVVFANHRASGSVCAECRRRWHSWALDRARAMGGG